MHLPNLISDLTLILITAAVTTLLFKKLNQPLVLGYIVAGILTGPHLRLIPSVMDIENIMVWSEIGVIILMFALGLEFSFHKLANVGQTAILLAMTEVLGMLLFGLGIGTALGWNLSDSMILGAVLSMSSTTIIIKAFEELDLKGKKFTEIVFGGLIVEDIIGIFVMVFLSTIAISKGAGGSEIAFTIVKLLFYLVLWLLLGIYIIPTLLRKANRLMNDETLLVVSLGVCFGMVLLFVRIGFSEALGAFIAGSILAGTMQSERIEHLNKPVKDLFGSIFFISVGMMVDPSVIVEFAVPIILITLVTILGKLTFSPLGVILAGNRLHTAVYCGASLAQIGEFSFIIVQLAITLNLVDSFMYPVVVSVSVVTTFTTPFCIKHAENIYNIVKKILPDKVHQKLDSYTSDTQTDQEKDSHWKQFLKKYFTGMLIYSVIIVGIIQFSTLAAAPFINKFIPGIFSNILCMAITLLLVAPFIRVLLYPRNKELTLLLIRNRANHLPMRFFIFLRAALSIFFIMYIIHRFMAAPFWWLIIPSIIITVLLSRFDALLGRYLQIEARFLTNFNEKRLNEWALNEKGESICDWISDELWVSQYRFKCDHGVMALMQRFKRFRGGEDPVVANLMNLKLYGINVIKVITGKKHINIPYSTQKLHDGDILFLLGAKAQIESYSSSPRRMLFEHAPPVLLRDFIMDQDENHEERHIHCFAVDVVKNSFFADKSIKNSGIRKKWNCLVIGIQRDVYPIVYPDIRTILTPGDKVWLIGSQKTFKNLVHDGLIETDFELVAE